MKQFSEAFGQRLEGSGVTRIQWVALYYISNQTYISQRELSKKMRVKDSSVGRLIDRLERDGFVERHKSKNDRRVICLSLTESGLKDLKKIYPLALEFSNDLTEGISDEDLDIFEKVLNKMQKNIKKED